MVASATAIPVALAAGASADDAALASRTAINLIASADVVASGATDHIIITNNAKGTCTATADGTAATGFAFSTSQPGTNAGISLASKYFFISAPNAGADYYIWFKVSGVGTDPLIPAMTGVEVDILIDDSANAVADAVAAAIDFLVPFAAPNPPANVITVTNASSGPFIPAHDFNTGFTFAITGGGSTTVNVNIMAMSI